MKHGNKALVTCLALVLTSINAQATLTPETVNGVNLVYNSGTDTTWTQDANLLATWEGAYQSTSYTQIVTAIINANDGVIHDIPNIYDTVPNSGTYTLSTADFGSGGIVDWWAGIAFVNYLNTTNYAGSDQWILPRYSDLNSDYYLITSQLDELFHIELYGKSIHSGPFSNVSNNSFFTSGGEYGDGIQWPYQVSLGYYEQMQKANMQFQVWAYSPGQVSAVPLPTTVWLFVCGFSSILALTQIKKK